MKPFKDFFLNEALDIQRAREHKTTRKNSKAYSIPEINRVFGDKDRLIYDFDLDLNTSFEGESKNVRSRYNQTKDFLSQFGFNIPDIKSYIKGFCFRENDKNIYKIGKVLEKYTETQPEIGKLMPDESVKMLPKYTYYFKSDPIRHVKEEPLKIVISRHPYDIFGMSTDRMWTSCMDLKSGGNTQFLPKEVMEGTLIAYLVPASEMTKFGKIALKKPVSRVALKPLRNKENELAYGVGKCYGAEVKTFQDFCREWVVENFNSKVQNKEGFSLKNVYPDPIVCDYVSELSGIEKIIRQKENELEEIENEFLRMISPKDRDNVMVYFAVEKTGESDFEISGGVNWYIRTKPGTLQQYITRTRESINQQTIAYVGNDETLTKLANDFGFNNPFIFNNKYYKRTTVNNKLGVVKIIFGPKNDTFQEVWDFAEMLKDFLKIYHTNFQK